AGKIALPDIGAPVPALTGELTSPGVPGAVETATTGRLPLRLGGQCPAGPGAVGQRVVVRDVHHRMVLQILDSRVRPARMRPIGALDAVPPRGARGGPHDRLLRGGHGKMED